MTVYHYRKASWILVILLATVLGGCAQKEPLKKDPFFEKWRVMAENSRASVPPRRRTVHSLRTTIPKSAVQPAEAAASLANAAPAKKLPTTPVSLKMHDIDVSVLLRALAKAADQNIMINEKVKGKANINISRAPWDQVFLGLLRTHGLSYSWEGDILRIMTVDDMEQDLKREAQKRGFRLVAPLVTQVVQINYSEASKLKANLEKFLTVNDEGKPLGSIMVDEHTNSLIIQSIQADIDNMLPIIEELDRPTDQIRIEAQIVEASKNIARELGIQWGGLSRNGFWITPGANSAGVLGNTLDAGINPTSGMAANFPAALGDLGLTLGFAVEDVGSSIIAAQLSALQNNGKVNILSSPSITTLDNQKAIFKSGKKVPYQTREQDGTFSVKFQEAVLSLEVIPHVIDGKALTLSIKATKDEIDETVVVLGQPGITTKNAETNVLLFDGQTTVIGGLSREKTDRSENGVPALKDLPLLGWLFKNSSDSNEMEDLLIFITPHILKEQIIESTGPEGAGPVPPPADSETVPQ